MSVVIIATYSPLGSAIIGNYIVQQIFMIVDALRYALVSRLHLAIFEEPVMTSENRLRNAKSEICAIDIDSYIYHSVFLQQMNPIFRKTHLNHPPVENELNDMSAMLLP